jgi:hemerythrin superfamily protein
MPRQPSGEKTTPTSQETAESGQGIPPGDAEEKTTASSETSAQPEDHIAHSNKVDSGTKAGEDAVALLKNDHREAESLFENYKTAKDLSEKKALASRICRALVVHAMLEEEVFYPACRAKAAESQPLDEA